MGMIKYFGECASKCENCLIHYVSTCLVGHGDDDFVKATKRNLKKALSSKYLTEERKDQIREKLKEEGWG